jgi:hypothetical protein
VTLDSTVIPAMVHHSSSLPAVIAKYYIFHHIDVLLNGEVTVIILICMFFCSECKKEFCLFDEKGKQRGSIKDIHKDETYEEIIETRRLSWFCRV